jgi:hypothetical protein
MAASSQAPVVPPGLSRSEGKGIESKERTDDDFVIALERCARAYDCEAALMTLTQYTLGTVPEGSPKR